MSPSTGTGCCVLQRRLWPNAGGLVEPHAPGSAVGDERDTARQSSTSWPAITCCGHCHPCGRTSVDALQLTPQSVRRRHGCRRGNQRMVERQPCGGHALGQRVRGDGGGKVVSQAWIRRPGASSGGHPGKMQVDLAITTSTGRVMGSRSRLLRWSTRGTPAGCRPWRTYSVTTRSRLCPPPRGVGGGNSARYLVCAIRRCCQQRIGRSRRALAAVQRY